MFRFLFNKITPTLTIILVLVLALVIVGFIFRKKSTLVLRTILGPIVLIGIGVVIYSFTRAIKPPLTPMSSTAMFKKIEYIEHLKLVSFYSEEVLVLGTKEKVQKLVDKLELQLKALNEEVIVKDSNLVAMQETLDALIIEMADGKEDVKTKKNTLKDKETKFKAFKKCKLTELCALPTGFNLDSSLDDLYKTYENAFTSHKVLQDSFQAKPWSSLKRKARREERKRMKNKVETAKLQLEEIHEDISRSLEREVDIERNNFEDLQVQAGDIEDEQAADKKLFTKQRNALRKEWKKAVDEQKRVEKKLKEASLELAFAKEAGTEIEPEVLVIAPAEISVFINMKNIEMNVEEMEDSIITVVIPPIEFDPTLIELPDSATVYEIDQNRKELVSSKQGAYYDLFGQLKETILEKQSEVKGKAIANGILQEGEKMAHVYLENFMRPLGLKMEFVQMRSDTLGIE